VSAAEVTVDVVLGGIGCLLLWLRRRWQVGIAIAIMPIVAVSAFSTVAVLLAVFTVAVHRRTSIALGIAAGNLACSLVFPLWRPLRASLWVVSLFSAIIVAALVAWGMFVRARRQLVWSLRERVERAETEQRMLADQARAAERTRIAREMHDVLAHRISLIALHAGALEVLPEMAGEAMLSPSVTRTLLAHVGDSPVHDRRAAATAQLASLSDREREVGFICAPNVQEVMLLCAFD
jgi:signal transduction histidine kinase